MRSFNLRNALTSVLLLSMTIMFCQGAFGQSSNVKKGNEYYDRFDFKTAVMYYKRALDKNPGDLIAQMKLADAYRHMNNSLEAEAAYAVLYNMGADVDPAYKFYYAQELRTNQKYDDAKRIMEEYAKDSKDDPTAKSIAAGLNIIDKLSADNPAYDVQLAEFNSDHSDFGPFVTGTSVVFASNRAPGKTDKWTDEPFLQLYESMQEASTGQYSSNANLYTGKYPNGRYHDGPICIDPKTKDMYITRNNYTETKPIKASDEKTVNLKIYRLAWLQEESRYADQLQEFPYNSNEYSCAHASISRDGEYLFFASDMTDSRAKGGVDIYMCKKQGDSWASPQNLSNLNSKGDDMFPFIASDNVLYFASDGQFGLGGLDIYYSKWQGENKWDRIANMGAPVNTNYDDFGLSLDESASKGFFASNRPGGVGDDDIYAFKKNSLTICGEVYDAQTGEKISGASVKVLFKTNLKDMQTTDAAGYFCADADPYKSYTVIGEKEGYFPNELIVNMNDQNQEVKIPLSKNNGINLEVTVIDAKTKAPIDAADVVLVNDITRLQAPKITDAKGKTFFTLDPDVSYSIIASKNTGSNEERYLSNSTTINTKGVKAPASLFATIELRKERKNVPIALPNIYYDLDKYNIRPDAALELDKVVKILMDNPGMEIEMSSHTDCRASAEYNRWLSKKRAESAVFYLTSRGIDPQRMVIAGYGETRLTNNCSCENDSGPGMDCTEEQHQMNRRTEFTILKF